MLLSLDDIATLYRCSRRHARDVIIRQDGFPKPVPGSTPRKQLWSEDAVKRFILSLVHE